MKIISFFIILLLLQISFNCSSRDKVQFIRTNDYSTLRLTIKDLQTIIESIKYFNKLENDSVNLAYTFSCDLKKNNGAITISDFSQIENLNIEDESFTEVSIYYSSSYTTITEASLILGYYSRRITAKGYDEKQVNALFNDINDQLEKKEQLISAVKISFIFLGCILLTAILAFANIFNNFQKFRRRNNTKSFNVIYIVSWGILLTSIIIISGWNLENNFPGVMLTQFPKSWINDNANIIGLIGFGITILQIIISASKWVKSNDKPEINASDQVDLIGEIFSGEWKLTYKKENSTGSEKVTVDSKGKYFSNTIHSFNLHHRIINSIDKRVSFSKLSLDGTLHSNEELIIVNNLTMVGSDSLGFELRYEKVN